MTILRYAIVFVCFLAIVCLPMISCDSDKIQEAIQIDNCDSLAMANNIDITYDGEVQLILDTYCAYNSNCHGTGSPTGDYSFLSSDLQKVIDPSNDVFKTRVIDERNNPALKMPPDYAEEDTLQNLPDLELQIIQCWVQNGYN